MDDPNWIKEYNKYHKDNSNSLLSGIERYRSYGDNLKYVFRSIEKYLPWINNVHMIVMSDSQTPNWINIDNVNIIYHKDFIPQKYLSLFNSSAIEMFLGNLKIVSNKFIYSNDDMYINKPLYKNMFFNNNKLIKPLRIRKYKYYWDMLRLCDYKLIYGNNILQNTVLCDEHGIVPYIKQNINNCYKTYEKEINNSITKFRENNNYNRWIFDIYDFKYNYTINKNIHNCYRSYLSTTDYKKLDNYYEFCLNDDDNVTAIDFKKLYNYLESRFPNKSKYEI